MSTSPVSLYEPRLERRRRNGKIFEWACRTASFVGLAFLVVLLGRVVWEGGSWVTVKFLTSYPSQLTPANAGVKSAIFGTIWLISITLLASIPVGVGAAIYLEEFASNSRLTRFIHVNIANLAGVPSIVYGILGLAVFVRFFRFNRSVLAGGLTLSLLIMPVIIIAAREALVGVPQSIRHAALALGATRWQTVRSHVLPSAIPGITTGVILAVSRALGEAAPLLILGGLTYVRFVPAGPFDEFTALPLQIYNWCDQPQREFQHLASAGIIVLLGILFPLNAAAITIRSWRQRKKTW